MILFDVETRVIVGKAMSAILQQNVISYSLDVLMPQGRARIGDVCPNSVCVFDRGDFCEFLRIVDESRISDLRSCSEGD